MSDEMRNMLNERGNSIVDKCLKNEKLTFFLFFFQKILCIIITRLNLVKIEALNPFKNICLRNIIIPFST